MKKPGGSARKKTASQGKRNAATRLDRARAALVAATDSDAWARATFRLMLATAPSAFASAALRCSSMDAALWLNSKGVRIHSAEFPRVMADHPGIPYLRQRPGLKVLPTRGVLPPQEELEKTAFYREFMVPYEWRHALGLCFWKKGSQPGLECVMSVNRTAEEGDFTEAETERLGALHGEIDRARLRVTAIEEERAARSSFEHFAENLPVPLALLSWEFQPLYHNRPAREICALWADGASSRQRKINGQKFVPPPALLAACREMQAEWRERIRSDCVGESVLERTVRQDGLPGLSATVRLLHLTGATLGDPTFTIQFESPRPHPRHAAPSLEALLRLTPAQRAVTLLASALKTNAEIAIELGRSIGTIKAALHAAYKKLGVRNRAELISRLRE